LVGSGHPLVSQSDIQAYIERKQKQSNIATTQKDIMTGPNVKDITKALSKWTIVDDEKILRGPEIKYIPHLKVTMSTLSR
jgi:hypothetical protein